MQLVNIIASFGMAVSRRVGTTGEQSYRMSNRRQKLPVSSIFLSHFLSHAPYLTKLLPLIHDERNQ
jgi:hypothetical protein